MTETHDRTAVGHGTTTGPPSSGDGRVGAHHYRYPGSPPFTDDELHRLLFTGRDSEAETILHSILATNLFLLYAVSGLGKTSLLNAGVMHELRARGHWPVVARLNDPDTSPIVEIRQQIEEAAAADPAVELVDNPDFPAGRDRDGSLWDLLSSIEVWRDNELQRLVLVLDQFEEIFTLGWDPRVRSRFFADFGEVIRGHRPARPEDRVDDIAPDVKIVLVIREDSLGELHALTQDVPQIMRNQFRLCALDLTQAERAIRVPAALEDERLASQPFTYTAEAVSEILEFLRTQTIRGSVVQTDTIDPSQLQILCQHIERRIVPEKAMKQPPGARVEIDDDDLGGPDGLGDILTDFYARTVASFPTSQQSAIRNLCEHGLINRSQRRLSLEEAEIGREYGVPPAVLQQLVDERLLRAEPRVGSVYYELAHDTLVGSVLADRDERRAARRSRRRRVAIALAAVAVVVAALVLTYWFGPRDTEAVPGDQTTALDPGASMTGTIDAESAAVAYWIDADDSEATMVRVVPVAGPEAESAGLAIVMEVTRVDTGESQRQEQPTPGVPLEMLVPPAPDGNPRYEIRVSRYQSTSGAFQISTEVPTEVNELELDTPVSGAIDSPGDAEVYRLERTAGVPTVVRVDPTVDSGGVAAGSGGSDTVTEKSSLDVGFEVVDSSGRARSVNAWSGTGGIDVAEQLTITEFSDEVYVVVRGRNTTGPFTVRASESDSEQLSLERPKSTGVVARALDTVGYVVTVGDDDGPVAVSVVPGEGFDAVLEITAPDGGVQPVDRGGDGQIEAAILDGAGQYEIVVSGWEYSAGAFDISIDRLETLSTDSPGRSTGQAAFSVDVGDDEWYALSVTTPADDTGVETVVIDPTGKQVSSGALAALGGLPGRFLVIVNLDVDVDVTTELRRMESRELTADDIGEVQPDGQGPTRFELSVAEGEWYVLDVVPDDLDPLPIEIQVTDPLGVQMYFGPRAVFGGNSGTYGMFVTTYADPTGFSYRAALETTDPVGIGLGETVRGSGAAVLAVDIDEPAELIVDFDQADRSGSSDAPETSVTSALLLYVVRTEGIVDVAYGPDESGMPARVDIGGEAGVSHVSVTVVAETLSGADAEFVAELLPLDGAVPSDPAGAVPSDPADAAPSDPASTAPATTTPPANLRYSLPVDDPAASWADTHSGYPATDIFVTGGCGAPVLSPVDGVLLEVRREDEWSPDVDNPATRGGRSVSILGDDGVRYYLAHFGSIETDLVVGDRVSIGTPLGRVGDSGRSSACHLHLGISPPCLRPEWSVRRGVVWPYPYLDAWRAGEPLSPVGEVDAWTDANPTACEDAANDPYAADS